MKWYRKVISTLLVALLLLPSMLSFADGDGTSASLTGGNGDGSNSDNPPESTVSVGQESVLVASIFDPTMQGYSDTETESESHTSGTGVNTTVVQAQINDRKILDHIAQRLQRYSGRAPVAYNVPTSWPGTLIVETIDMPVSVLDDIADDGLHISQYSSPNPDKQNEVKERGAEDTKKYPWMEQFDLFALEGSEDFRLWLAYVLSLGSGNQKQGSWPCPLPDIDIDELLASLETDEELRAKMEKTLHEMSQMESINIEGQGARVSAKDYYTYHDRYEALSKYLFLCQMNDTVKVQHIVETDIESATKAVTVSEYAAPYPAGMGYGDGRAMYAWTIECLDSPFENDIGCYEFVGTSNDQYFPFKFTTTGKYKFTFSQNIIKTTREAVSFNCWERWIIAQTGQTIYERHTKGYINRRNDGLNRSDGRAKDRLTAYMKYSVDQAVYSECNDLGVCGREMGCRILNVIGDPNQLIPDLSVINTGSSTYRQE